MLKMLPQRKKNRFFLTVSVASFFVGFFIDSGNNSKVFYEELAVVENSIQQIKKVECKDFLDLHFRKKIEEENNRLDLDVMLKNQQTYKNCIDIMGSIERYGSNSIDADGENLRKKFDQKYNHYILKNNFLVGLIFFIVAVAIIAFLNFISKIYSWIVAGN